VTLPICIKEIVTIQPSPLFNELEKLEKDLYFDIDQIEFSDDDTDTKFDFELNSDEMDSDELSEESEWYMKAIQQYAIDQLRDEEPKNKENELNEVMEK
jgi:hypothetical protein